MPNARRFSWLLVASALLPASALAASPRARSSSVPSALRNSRNLWATIDECTPKHKHNWIGIRGSMPGDGHAQDAIYMRFRVQYLDRTANRWTDLANQGARFFSVGPARSGLQSGRSFYVPPPAGSSLTLRGVVDFQWRHGATVLASLSRPTDAGHPSVEHADPPGFSAATCQIA